MRTPSAERVTSSNVLTWQKGPVLLPFTRKLIPFPGYFTSIETLRCQELHILFLLRQWAEGSQAYCRVLVNMLPTGLSTLAGLALGPFISSGALDEHAPMSRVIFIFVNLAHFSRHCDPRPQFKSLLLSGCSLRVPLSN